MFEWDDARHFLAVHRTGSLSAAARQLGVNQSTVGRRLDALEERLKAKLFYRTRDGLRIAPAGERLLPHAERMEDEAIAIAREISGQETTLTGSLRITAPDFFGARVVAPLLSAFHARYPEIEIELDTDNRVRNLTKREADMAVRMGGAAEAGVVIRKLCPFVSSLYASNSYLQAHGLPRGLDFTGHHLVGFGEPVARISESLWLLEHASTGRIVFRSHNTHAQLQACVDGMGIAPLPRYVGDPEPDLVRLEQPEEVVRQDIWLVVHEDLRHTARVRVCADFLSAGIRGQAARFSGDASGIGSSDGSSAVRRVAAVPGRGVASKGKVR
jgi:DNA-binding transcriptional LysR family regulator